MGMKPMLAPAFAGASQFMMTFQAAAAAVSQDNAREEA